MRFISQEESFTVVQDYEFMTRVREAKSKKSKVLDNVELLKVGGDDLEVMETDWDLKTSIYTALYNRVSVPHGRRFQITPFKKKSTGELGWYIHRYQ